MSQTLQFQLGLKHGKTGNDDRILIDQSPSYYDGVAEGMRIHRLEHPEDYHPPAPN